MNREELLQRMIRIRSVYPEERDLANYIELLLREEGFEVERVEVNESRFCIVADRGDPSLGFYGHLDTVPVQGDWNRDPFEPETENGRMYGLGAFDMLGGISAFITAALETDEDIRLVFGVDEELYSRGAYQLAEEEYLDDLEALIVPEIADTSAETDFPTAILGRRGRTLVEIEVEGDPAHGATPEQGESAVQRALQTVQILNRIETREHERLGEESFFIRSIESEADSLSIPETAVIEVDAHLVRPSTPSSFLERVRDNLPEFAAAELGERPNPYLEPYTVEESEFEALLDLIEEIEGYQIGYGLSVADENVLAQHVPVLVLGPEGGNPHDADEWVDLESLETLTYIFKNLISSGVNNEF